MKTTLLAIAACVVAGTLPAQITITQNDIAPLYTQVRQVNDTLPTVTAGSAGTNQTWNFSALNTHTIDTLTFTLPQFTPYGSSFPMSNLSVINSFGGNPNYTYLINSASSLQIAGQAADPLGTGTMAIPFSDPEEMVGFSSTYNSSFTDTAQATVQAYYGQDPGIGFTVDSFRIHLFVRKTSVVDAWGSLTDPAGTYNVIRQNALRAEWDTIDIYAFGGWIPDFFDQMDSDRVYTFWANGAGFPVVQLTDMQDLGTITQATWLLSTAQVGIAEHNNESNLSVYPNPASDHISFNTTGTNAAYIRIFDVTGKMIATQEASSDRTEMNVSAFAPGMYFFQAMDANGNVINTGKFNKL